MNTPELVLICQKCGGPVASGCLWVDYAEIVQTRTARAEQAARPDGAPLDIVAFIKSRGDALWKVHHDGCTDDPADGYLIDAERLRTWDGLAHWTAHLMEKNWFLLTDWNLLLREVAGERTGHRRIMRHLRSAA